MGGEPSAFCSPELTTDPRFVPCSSCQILLLDGTADAAVFGDEALDEFMQAGLKDVLDTQIFQPGAHHARLFLRRSLAAVGLRDFVEMADDVLAAVRERARHFLLQDKKI